MTAIIPVGVQIGEVAVAEPVRRHRCVTGKPEGNWLRIVEQQQGLELPDRRDLVRCQTPLRGVDRLVRLAVPSAGGVAGIYGHNRTGHVAGIVGSQEGHHSGHLLRFGQAPHGDRLVGKALQIFDGWWC